MFERRPKRHLSRGKVMFEILGGSVHVPRLEQLDEPAMVLDLLDRVAPDPVQVGQANAVVVGETVVLPACPPRVRAEIEARGFTVAIVDVSEFHRAGGSIRCLTNPLDIAVGRDLDPVQGGAVNAAGPICVLAVS